MSVDAFFANFLVAGQAALALIARAVLPVLFPFFVLTGLLLELFPTKNKLVLAGLSYLSGYPNGARLTKTLFEQGQVTAPEARQLSILTSTPSPMFVIATVGTIFLQNTWSGIVIFLCSVGGAIINAILWHTKSTPAIRIATPTSHQPNFFRAFNTAVRSATAAMINVSGIILFFYVFASILHLPVIITGLLEMTSGVAQTLHPILIEFFVSFGGLSVAAQNLLFAESYHLRLGHYCLYKFTHAVLACALLTLCLPFIN